MSEPRNFVTRSVASESRIGLLVFSASRKNLEGLVNANWDTSIETGVNRRQQASELATLKERQRWCTTMVQGDDGKEIATQFKFRAGLT
jgi:hypothetical protein